MKTKLERIAEISASSPRPEFTALYHLINKEMFGLDVLNQDTIKGYRIIFEQLHSGHPWNALEMMSSL